MTDWPFGDLPRRHFGVISADPAWRFVPFAPPDPDQQRHDTERHYDTMALNEIKQMPVSLLAAPDCHLFMWVIGSHLPHALDVMDAWGFQYSAIAFQWVKLKRSLNLPGLRFLTLPMHDLDSLFHFGMGKTTRKNPELCLLGRRGSPRRLSAAVRELIVSPVREHSRKPNEAYQRMERYAEGPYLEMFSRENREGWSHWGDELGKFDQREAAE